MRAALVTPARRAANRTKTGQQPQCCAQRRPPLHTAQLTEQNQQHNTTTARSAAQPARSA
ncbi:hypothetical protein A2U01_0064538 [Trifolium medium]|uniref:Uncharacterized protein n=1 Tax=Trifolium medium TaxID=97028 RepID=A0A392S323_9FABA|nr:hypothetical protein [Trifolium medium]